MAETSASLLQSLREQPDGDAWHRLVHLYTPLLRQWLAMVPRDLAPLYTRQIILDVTGIMSSLAVTIASLAVLAKQ